MDLESNNWLKAGWTKAGVMGAALDAVSFIIFIEWKLEEGLKARRNFQGVKYFTYVGSAATGT